MKKIWIKDGEFVDITDEQKEALSVEELAEYTTAKTTNLVRSLISDSQKENVKKEDIDKRVKEINEEAAKLTNKQMADLKAEVDKLTAAAKIQGATIKGLEEKGKNQTERPLGFKAAMKLAILEKKDILISEKNDDNGKRLSLIDYFNEKGNSESPIFTAKVAVDMLQSNIAQSEVNLVRLTELDPNRVGIPLTIYPHVFDWMPKKGLKTAYMSVLVVYSYEDGSGTKTEGSASSKSSFLLKTVQFKAFYNATYFTLSDETLDDLDEVMDEIAITAPSKILDSIDGKILGTTGNGTTDIKGLFASGNFTAFATATYTDTVAGASIIDLIAKAKLQCEGNKYRPNVVVMNPTDIDNMAALKDANDNSVTDRRVRWDQLGNPAFVMGMRIIASTAITADTLSVIDQAQLIIGMRKDMTMQIGLNGTDLTEGQKTVVIKVRNAFAVRDIAGVIYSAGIAADVEAINNSGQ